MPSEFRAEPRAWGQLCERTRSVGTDGRVFMKAKTYQLKITLEGIRPPVWRRLEALGNTTLGGLHDVFQTVMGWSDCHLHLFTAGGSHFGPEDPDAREPLEDERKVRLDQVLLRRGDGMVYEYDFGDSWIHRVDVEEIGSADSESKRYPLVTGGKRACPPEDCGGVFGYMDLLQTLADPGQPDHLEKMEWFDEDFDSEAFDLEKINRLLHPD